MSANGAQPSSLRSAEFAGYIVTGTQRVKFRQFKPHTLSSVLEWGLLSPTDQRMGACCPCWGDRFAKSATTNKNLESRLGTAFRILQFSQRSRSITDTPRVHFRFRRVRITHKMQYSKCKCGAAERWCSGEPIRDCEGCSKCNTTLSFDPSGHRVLKPHNFAIKYDSDTGKPNRQRCIECHFSERLNES